MILHIDTRGGSAAKDRKAVTVSLKKDGQVMKSLSEQNEYGSQVLLPLIMKLMKLVDKLCTKSFKIPQVSIQIHPKGVHSIGRGIWRELKGIEVETGPGSFTGLRVGVSIANALGFSLGIPVNGKKMETELVY